MKKFLAIILACSICQTSLAFNVHAELIDIVEENMTAEILPDTFEAPDPTKADRFIIKYSSDIDANRANNEVKRDIKKIKDVVSIIDQSDNVCKVADTHAANISVIKTEEAVDIDDFKNKLTQTLGDDIEYIQPDYRLDLSAEEDDAMISDDEETALEEYLQSDEEENENANYLEDASEEVDSEEDEQVLVAIIDTGIDIHHSMLANSIYTNENEINNEEDSDNNGYVDDINGWDFYNNTSSVYNVDLGLDQAHGTHIAGIVAHTAPNAKILPLKVFENGTAYTSDIISAISYAQMMGADIVNCSWGCTDENMALKEAMEDSNMTFVCAAGNSRLNLNEVPIYPACYDLDNIISVTSVNDDGGLSYYSNYSDVDIAATGRNIESAFPGNQMGTLSGTSISAAFVSGALGLCNDVDKVLNTADKLSNLQDKVVQGRRLNIDNLINDIEPNEITDIEYTEDFNTEGYSRTTAENWSLFQTSSNISVAAGNEFVAVLKEDGTVWTWGSNSNGQLGVGNYTSSSVPQQVPSISGVEQIAAGLDHMVALKSNGQVYAWGNNTYGALGNGTTTQSNIPVAMTNGNNAVYIAAGRNVSYVIKNGGDLYVCGDNRWGQLGDGTTTNRTVLQAVSINEPIVKAEGDGGASFALTETGRVYSWGDNTYGRLGNGTTNQQTTPLVIINSGIVDLSMGFFDAIALSNSGEVYQWGYGYYADPILTATSSTISKVIAGRQSYFMLDGTTIKSKGNNTNGALGIGNTTYTSSWSNVVGEYVDFDITTYMGIALGLNGKIYTWGASGVDSTYNTSPVLVEGELNCLTPYDYATPVGFGSTNLSFDGIEDTQIYKYTTLAPEVYNFYSISNMDIMCSIYQQNNDGSYEEIAMNDNCGGIMSNNYYDFFTSALLDEGTTYYIVIYNNSGAGSYTLNIATDTGSTEYVINATEGEDSVVYINANNVGCLGDRTILVTYNSNELSLKDACAFTRTAELQAGTVAPAGIVLQTVVNGVIIFKLNNNAFISNKQFNGTLNAIKFTSQTDGQKTVRINMFK